MSELLVYKASAGAGKTFTLAVQYMSHLILNPRAYRQILAVTFTNKATAEMKERILTQLYGIQIAHPASEPYLKALKKLLPQPMTDEEIRLRAHQALTAMAHDYGRFRVETIDSFFQSVMRNLGRELELTPGLNVELDSNRVLADAVQSMMQKLSPTSPVLAWLLEYIGERVAQDKRWNVTREVELFGRNIFSEEYIERGEELRQKLALPGYLKLYKEALRTLQEEETDRMKGFADHFDDVLQEAGVSVDELMRGKSGVAGYFRKLRDGKWSDKDVVNSSMQACLADAGSWVAKSSKRREEIMRLATEQLIPLLNEAESYRPKANRRLTSCRLTLQHLGELQLLNHLSDEVHTLNREQNRFLLADTTALLHQLMATGDASFIFEKMGATLRNVMIDEFQDTSRMQWDNFRLLLDEGLSQGADSLIVGDVKQSIYRWRNGDWNILNNLQDNRQDRNQNRLPYTIHVETLATNRRSFSRVIQFNNLLFKQLVESMNQRHLDDTQTPCQQLQQAYNDVKQESPRTEEEGYVQVSLLQANGEKDDYDTLTLNALEKAVRQLIDLGEQPDDIAVLVRKNRVIPQLADFFDQQMQLPVVSDEAFRLDASQTVCLLVDALRCLANEQDEVALRSLVKAYQTDVLGNEVCGDVLMRCKPDEMLPHDFTAGREELRMMPLYELTERLYDLFDLQKIGGQNAYLFAFFDAVNEYLLDHPSDPAEFLRQWDERLCGKTIATGSLHGLRICSIHKSKGLEFKNVLIPYCDWKLENETYDQLVWCIPQEAPFDRLPLVPVNYSSAMQQSVYGDDYVRERQQLWVDNINLLYVALTRACQRLYLFTQAKSNTIGEVLMESVFHMDKEGTGRWDENAQTYTLGQPDVTAPTSGKAKEENPNPLAMPPTPKEIRMQSLRHQVEFRQSNRSADFLAGRDEEHSSTRFIDRGLLLHTLFSTIHTCDDAPQAVERLLMEGVIRQEEVEELNHLVEHALQHPQVQTWYDGSWRLFNECEIVWMENGQLHSQRPDRVMMREDEVVVVDFKFGQPRRSHVSQVQRYMRLLASMHYAPHRMSGYLWYVDADKIVEVKP